jgi:hypothetical protein
MGVRDLLPTITPYVVVVSITFVLWTGIQVPRLFLLTSCDNQLTCITPLDYYRHDPYCVIDPACVSPLYKPYEDGPQDWTGVSGWRLGEGQRPPPATRALALPNLAAFLIVMAVIRALITSKVRSAVLTRVLLIGVSTWIFLEVGRWYFQFAGGQFDLFVAPEAVFTLGVSLAIVGYRQAFREFGQSITHRLRRLVL